MTTRQPGTILRYLRSLVDAETTRNLSDAQLLHQFATRREETAFAALVHRHGALVWSVCQHLLHHEQDAEDAFQATFLVLARRAGSIRKTEAVGSFLHGVAYRIALRAKQNAKRRQTCERQAVSQSPQQPPDDAAWRELQAKLDEEVARLPEKFRNPFILCCLEGKPREEAAREMRCKVGTVSSRIARARQLLQQRLSERGVTLSAALCAAVLWKQTGAAAVPPMLASSTLQAAAGSAEGFSTAATTLAEGALHAMRFARWQMRGLLILSVGLLGGGVGVSRFVAIAPPEAAPKEPPATSIETRKDLHGDPLPPGAIARLGTGRFRNGMFKPHFFPDGKTIMTANRHVLQFWETATGRLLREFPTGSLYVWQTALLADGKQAAATGIFLSPTSSQAALRVWDVSTGKEVRTFAENERKVDRTSLTFTPDGKRLVSIPGGALSFEDIASGKEIRHRQFSTDILPSFALAPNGETVAIAPGANTWKFYLWNWKAEEEPREIKAPRRPLHCLCFSPDSKVLAGCGQLASVVDLWDVRSGKVVRSIDLDKEAVCTCDLAFSPDGKLLAIADGGNSNRKNFSGGLYLWDLERDRYVHKLLTPGEQVLFTNFSRDGRWVAATTSRGVRVWELPTGRAVADSEAGHCGSLTRIAISSQGLAATASLDHTVRIWDTASGRQRLKLQHDQPVENMVLTPDGTSVVTATSMDNTICFWDINTGKEMKRLPGQKRLASGRAIGLTPDGRRLLSWADNRSLRIWDVPTGKVLREHTIPPGATGKSSREKDARRELLAAGMGPCCFSPDGAYFIFPFLNEFRVYETATGKEWQTIPSTGGRVNSLAVSSDGRSFLVSIDGKGEQSKQHTVSLWELATGKLRSSLSLPGQSAGPVALSHDGRYIAVGLPGTSGEIRLFRLTNPHAVVTFAGFTGKPILLSFSPNGRQLISGMDDTSALVWQLPSSIDQPAHRLERETIRRLWDDLASDDAVRAYQGILSLSQSPAEVVSFLDRHLQPVAVPDQKRIVQLIKDLDDSRFTIRSTAEEELEKLGELAESSLKTALARKPSLEARQRIEQLLSKLRGSISRPRLLQSVRAVEVLERIGTAEARRLLEQLTCGAPEARLTREANEALTRLKKR